MASRKDNIVIYVLWEILVPLVLAAGVGFLIAYLAFRWRRRLVHASEWNALSTKAQRSEIALAEANAAKDEAENERGVLAAELEKAKARIAELERILGDPTD